MNLSEEGKIKLSHSYIHMNRGTVIYISDTGEWKYAEVPDDVVLKLKVLNVRGDGFVMETTNLLNSNQVQYTYTSIVDGRMRIALLNSDFEEVKHVPADYWNPILTQKVEVDKTKE